LIDGEGCISLDKKHTLRIDVGMSSKGLPVLEWLVTHYGGTIRNTRAATDKWESAQAWMLLGEKAVAFLRTVAPYLVLKGNQAGVGIAFGDLRRRMPKTKTGRVRWTTEGRAEAQRLREALMDLNRKGPEHAPTLAGERIALLVGESWVSPQLDLLSEAGLTSFSETWPRAGMTRSGTASRLRPLAPLTAATGSGSLPTPNGRDWKDTGPSQGNRRSPNLGTVAHWPTPHGICQPGPRRPGPSGNELGRAVNEAETWPTPSARDGSHGGASDPKKRKEQGHAIGLDDAVHQGPGRGSLNPTWVAKLMGFPPDWLDL
jgi:hypothetical protein